MLTSISAILVVRIGVKGASFFTPESDNVLSLLKQIRDWKMRKIKFCAKIEFITTKWIYYILIKMRKIKFCTKLNLQQLNGSITY